MDYLETKRLTIELATDIDPSDLLALLTDDLVPMLLALADDHGRTIRRPGAIEESACVETIDR